MVYLAEEACTLRFTEYEFVEFFGVVGPFDEDACSYTYVLHRDGLRLEFTLFPLDGGAYTSSYRDGIAKAESPVVCRAAPTLVSYGTARMAAWRLADPTILHQRPLSLSLGVYGFSSSPTSDWNSSMNSTKHAAQRTSPPRSGCPCAPIADWIAIRIVGVHCWQPPGACGMEIECKRP